MIVIFELIILLFSVIIHEISHGFMAEKLGDPTARSAGRLTLNPVSHIDPFGSILLPLLLYFAHLPVLGWAKPVPYNPYNLKNPHKGAAMIAAAGPGSNLFLAAFFGILIRFLDGYGSVSGSAQIITFFGLIVYINLLLGIFNLIPIPPLDGSKILFFFLPAKLRLRVAMLGRSFGTLFAGNWLIVTLLFVILFPYVFGAIFVVVGPIINSLFTILTGGGVSPL